MEARAGRRPVGKDDAQRAAGDQCRDAGLRKIGKRSASCDQVQREPGMVDRDRSGNFDRQLLAVFLELPVVDAVVAEFDPQAAMVEQVPRMGGRAAGEIGRGSDHHPIDIAEESLCDHVVGHGAAVSDAGVTPGDDIDRVVGDDDIDDIRIALDGNRRDAAIGTIEQPNAEAALEAFQRVAERRSTDADLKPRTTNVAVPGDREKVGKSARLARPICIAWKCCRGSSLATLLPVVLPNKVRATRWLPASPRSLVSRRRAYDIGLDLIDFL